MNTTASTSPATGTELMQGELHCLSCGYIAGRIEYEAAEHRPRVKVIPISRPGVRFAPDGRPRCGRCGGKLYVEDLQRVAPSGRRRAADREPELAPAAKAA